MEIKMVNGSRYLGGVIGDRDADTMWLHEKVQRWEELVRTLSRVARNQPQSAYSGLQKSLQQEWAFVQWVTPNIGNAFITVEKYLHESFMKDLFRGIGELILGREVT